MPEPQTPQAPTEEQVKAANEAEFKKWEGDFDPETLKVPYSRDELDDDDKKNPDEDPKSGKDANGPEDDPEEIDDVYSDPEPAVTVEDPGEYSPADYSFEV